MIEERAFLENVVGKVSPEEGGRQEGPAFDRIGVIVSASAQQQRGNPGAKIFHQQADASDYLVDSIFRPTHK